MQSLNDMLTYERKKNKNSLMLLFKELNEMGNVLGSKSDDILQVSQPSQYSSPFIIVIIFF